MAEKKTLSVKMVLADIRGGLTDDELLKKYGISAKGLNSLMGKLVAAGVLKQSELDARSQLFEETVDIDEEISHLPPDNNKPAVMKGNSPAPSDLDQKLSKLKEALDAGIITQTEFESKKAGVLGQSSKLGKLKEAFEAGILSETEYEKKKSELTGQATSPASNRQMPAVSTHQSAAQSAVPTGQTKFALQIGETLIKEGYASYLKSTLNVVQGNGYLTSQRFVYCKKSTFLFYFLLGPLFGHLVKGTQVIFEIPLAQFSALSQQKHGLAKKVVLETKGGQQYGVQFISQDTWLKSIGETVINFVPGTTVKQDSEGIKFISNSTGQPVQAAMSPGDAVILSRTMPLLAHPTAQIASSSFGTTAGSGLEHLDIEPYYVGIFTEIEKGKLRSINGYALLGGAFWYFYKGMWLKGLVYFVFAVVLAVILPGVGALPVWVTASFYANWDYYLYKVHGEKFFTSHWVSNSFPVDLQKRFLVNE